MEIKNMGRLKKILMNLIPDYWYVKLQYKQIMGKSLNLSSPKTLSEKLNWLKVYYHNPLLHKLVDKAEVKEYVSNKIGADYTIPTIGLWNKVEDINISTLPDKFVLKCTHDSGSIEVCRNKETFDLKAVKERLGKGAMINYYEGKREWAYKGVPPRIIAEPFIPNLGDKDSIEYKLTVYNGKVRFISVCTGIAHIGYNERKNDHYTPEWQRLPFWVYYKPSGNDYEKPSFMDEMIRLTEKLAEGLPQVRIDWYVNEGKMLFGEMTFYTWAGYLKFNPVEWDEILGNWFELPKKWR